jgi:hypothetical protein
MVGGDGRRRRLMCIARASAWLVVMGIALIVTACEDTAADDLPDPLAGLQHPEMVRVGAKATLDGRLSAAASVEDPDPGAPLPGSRIASYRFAIADGSPAQERIVGVLEHVFTTPGDYGVVLTVADDRGIESSVASKIRVKQDYTPICGTDDIGAAGCASGQCMGDVCSVMACAGDAVCVAVDGSLQCVDGFCVAAKQP